MSPFLNAILPKLVLNKHFPRVVVHGSKKYGGSQLAHFFIEQGYLSLKFLLGHLREGSLTGTHFMVLLSQVQLVSGSSHPFLEEVDSNRHYVPHSWLSGIRHYLNYISASVKIPDAWHPTLQRKNNKMLMDEFETAKPGTATLDHLSRVRLYLGATTLADICDDSGMKIFAWALTGEARCRPA
eukprot:8369047-Ditylum_brightwellii.AAC.1